MSVQPLFTSVRMGDLDLPNRIVMAPLTRMRAGSIDYAPTALQAEYYAQRATRPTNTVGSARKPCVFKPCVFKWSAPVPNDAIRGGRGQSSRLCHVFLSRLDSARRPDARFTVNTEDVVFASSGGALPSHGGHIIWEGI
jgi:hypothetical protein